MANERKDEEAIFNAAIQLRSSTERDEYLAEACGHDNKLRAGVEALLQAHEAQSLLDVPMFDSEVTLDKSPLTESPGIGVCWRLEGFGLTTYDSFGNVECRPSGGKLFCGKSIDNDIKQFFEAQNVNPRLQVNTDWLKVGHVDEVISFAPDGTHTIVADPNVCWGLLLWAETKDPDAPMLQGMHNYGPSGQTVSYVLHDVTTGGRTLGGYNLDETWSTVDLPGVRKDLGLSSPEKVTKGSSGNGKLKAADAFVAFFPDSQTRYYLVEFTNDTEYRVYWSTDPDSRKDNVDPTIGNKDQDCVFTEALCLILFDRWEGQFVDGDHFEFEANPGCTTLEMPVLFEYQNDRSEGAVAYTVDHVNCFVDGSSVFTGNGFGPVVNHLGTESDILMHYVKNLFQKAALTVVETPDLPDSRPYHDRSGDIHCGTNVIRD